MLACRPASAPCFRAQLKALAHPRREQRRAAGQVSMAGAVLDDDQRVERRSSTVST
jgi:hypothetical protein